MVSGSGTQADPYVLSSFSDLELLGSAPYTLDKYYKLGADIDASPTQDANYNGGAGWLPRGEATTKFTGGFNGDGYEISGLYINRPTTDNVGLFGYVTVGITNLNLTDVNITGKSYVGGVVGRCSTGGVVFSSLLVTGSIKANSSYLGGVIGAYEATGGSGAINNCTNTADLSGTDYIGGIAGYCQKVNSLGCSVNADITGANYIGGIFGRYGYPQVTLQSFTIEGTISATGSQIGGAVGIITYGVTITGFDISNTLSISVSSTSDNIGGVVGKNESTAYTSAINNGSVAINITGRDGVGGIIGYTGITTFSSVSYTGTVTGRTNIGGIAGVWGYGSGVTFGTATVSGSVVGTGNNIGGFIGGVLNGGTVAGLNNKNISITASSTSDSVGGIIGGQPVASAYALTISKCISTKSISGRDNLGGIIGYAYNAAISDCMQRGNVSGRGSIGGMIGYLRNSTSSINRCLVLGDISGTGDRVGGMLGGTYDYNLLLTIDQCLYHGAISGVNYVGGIAGSATWSNTSSEIKNSLSIGTLTVSGTPNYAGGIAGICMAKITNCYSRMDVNGYGHTGGLVGRQDSKTITNSYSMGAVAGNNNVGGLVGSINTGTATDCFWDTQTSNQANSALGTGKTTAQMKDQNTYTNWDFNTPIWVIENNNHNKGYPYLFFLKYLDGSIAAAASLSTSLTVTPSAVTQGIVGVISAQSTISGDLKRVRSIAAAVTCSSSIVGSISRILEMESSMGGVGSNSASLSRVIRILSESTGGSFSSGILERLTKLNSNIQVVGNSTGDLSRGLKLNSNIVTAANSTGEISRNVNLDSETTGESTVTGELSKWMLFLSEVSGISSIMGMLQGIRGLQGRVEADSSLTANMIYITLLKGVITGVVNVTGRLSRIMLLAATITGTSYTSVILTYIINFKEILCNITFKQSSIKYKIFYNTVKSKIKQSKIIFRIID
ncbi:MAG: hypothetical protein AMQ22_00079 [Candidatus Methanofastidiosum methylothiophilum]|uniref:The GLUG motif protein n=1 Tax=Candidatus Methanofastidiosum methylothiophilum TaxID=1705564 RepID=A0A150J9G6_9EURY|nr:MAG: hypothetical protein AMQ22_00079 [Candidatus Methanofastidiosum methylthiophilus]